MMTLMVKLENIHIFVTVLPAVHKTNVKGTVLQISLVGHNLLWENR